MLTYDALRMSFRSLTVRRDPAAGSITGLVDYDVWCGDTAAGDGRGTPGASAAELTVDEPRELQGAEAALTVMDVREPHEVDLVGIGDAVSVPLGLLDDDAAVANLRRAAAAGRVVVYCASGVRSARAVCALGDLGIPAVSLPGGLAAWLRSSVGSPGG